MVVEEGIGKALAVPQEQLRSEKSTYIISTYNPNNSNVIPKVREIYGKLQTSKILGKIFAKYKLIDYKRKPSKLNRFLRSSNFPTNKSTFKTTKCGKSWFCSDYIIEGALFKFKNWYEIEIKFLLGKSEPYKCNYLHRLQ